HSCTMRRGHQRKTKFSDANYPIGTTRCLARATIDLHPQGAFLLTKCMDHERFELQTLFESIFQLGGEAFIRDDSKTIELEMNPKEPNLMSKLNKGLSILNTIDIRDLNGRFVTFNMRRVL
ncbi:MAG: hypothetical protein U9N36_00535, partial [Euryarchaeota archaeon]|nr:hypothetical protein [Euryarchaeota archaeon]